MSNTFKEILDVPEWRPASPSPGANADGTSICCDLRNTEDRNPYIYFLRTNAILYKYHIKNDEWWLMTSPAITNAIGAGSDTIFHPSKGPAGTISSASTTTYGGSTVTTITLNTALGTAVAVNQLANRGDGRGYRIKIVGNRSGGDGKTEEALIVANTAGTQPVITLDKQLTFSPANGDGYEILSGTLYLLGTGAIGASTWKSIDIATMTLSALSSTNLPSTITTDSHLVALSELHVPYNAKPGEGMIQATTPATYNNGGYKCLQATNSGSTSLTGQTADGDYAIAANEYRNFQIRIVEDTAIPTAVGQRRNITSHTGGAGTTPVYTVPSWTVTPSTNAKYVIEYNSDRIICFTTANGNNYAYTISGNAWDVSTTWAVRGANCGAGVTGDFAFGAPRDPSGHFKHSYLYSIRGGGSNAIDVFDIAGATTGSWSLDIAYGSKSAATTFSTGNSGGYNPFSQSGKYFYINVNGTQRNARFDMVNRVLEPWGYVDYTQGTAVVGRRVCVFQNLDGSTPMPIVNLHIMASALMFQNLVWR